MHALAFRYYHDWKGVLLRRVPCHTRRQREASPARAEGLASGKQHASLVAESTLPNGGPQTGTAVEVETGAAKHPNPSAPFIDPFNNCIGDAADTEELFTWALRR